MIITIFNIRRIFNQQSSGHANLVQASIHWSLPRDKRSMTRGVTLLAVIVGEARPAG